MKSLFLGFLFLSLAPSLAMANMCRALYENPIDRGFCDEALVGSGASSYGDWIFQEIPERGGGSFMAASNYALPNYNESKDENASRRIVFHCVTDSSPMIRIYSGENLRKGSDMLFKFDSGGYYSLSQIDPHEASAQHDNGAKWIIDRNIIMKILSSSIFEVKLERNDGVTIEHTYTLSGSEMITSSDAVFKCLR